MSAEGLSQKQGETRTAKEAGWHVSRYNVSARVPETSKTAIANLFKGNCAVYNDLELYLLSVLDELDEHHPIIDRFAKRGIIANFDERAALESMGRAACAMSGSVGLTICPTMGCNFDCPYCFENHARGKMSPEVQDDVIALAERMIAASNAKHLSISWFGGEPLLYPDVIESLSKRLMALAKERGASYSASIITNGYLLTQDVVDMLERVSVKNMQVTIDGLGVTHDLTRHLAGGGPTFDRITENLRTLNIPFSVSIRHNVHEGNVAERDDLEAFVKGLAEESGNDLTYYPSLVSGSQVADDRGKQVGLLCGSDAAKVDVAKEALRFAPGRGYYCGAHSIWSVGIDERGNLVKCWEAVDKEELAFATAHDWDPANPLQTASNLDNLTMYLNTASPVPDEECRNCVWLPTCAGGCPNKRLFDRRTCPAYKDNPEEYVLALYARIGEESAHDKDAQGSENLLSTEGRA